MRFYSETAMERAMKRQEVILTSLCQKDYLDASSRDFRAQSSTG